MSNDDKQDDLKTERPGFEQRAVSGALVTGGGTIAKAVLQVLAIVVLARLLSPEDFGVMAMVFPLIAFATIFQEAGLGLAVLQRDRVSDEELSTIFWINFAAGAVLGGLMLISAPFVAAFYDEPRVAPLTAASGTLMILAGLSAQHVVMLSRSMAFGRLAIMDAVSLSVGTAAAILLAYVTRSYWALFALPFGTSLTMCILAWGFNRWRPGPRAPLGQVADVLRFGGNITLSNLAIYFGRNLDKILIGRFVGSVALGFYERAYKVVLMPILFVHMPLFRIVVPMLAQTRNEAARHRRIFLRAFQLSLLITVPGTVLLIAAAPEIVSFVMGDKWLDAAPIFAWLAVATLGQLATSPFSMIFVAQDRSREAMISSIATSLWSSLAFVVGLPWGAVGVAAAYAISELVRTPFLLWYATRTGPVTWRDTAEALAPFVLAGLGGCALVYSMTRIPALDVPVVLLLCGGVASFALTLACQLLNRPGREFLLEGRVAASNWLANRSLARQRV